MTLILPGLVPDGATKGGFTRPWRRAPRVREVTSRDDQPKSLEQVNLRIIDNDRPTKFVNLGLLKQKNHKRELAT
ncbi:hypothetical protein [Moorena sp. SIO4G3]|uniref:hypothetical protein n=1 Tax=Moorena sp. SIO4G3 TaxID=2607821 RepID=UPI001429B87F|nr:hypothetical protein [Moorena sp. SIO4G3]NEO75291.1 hypothetical protein [Moorena sp. SIO4G3]